MALDREARRGSHLDRGRPRDCGTGRVCVRSARRADPYDHRGRRKRNRQQREARLQPALPPPAFRLEPPRLQPGNVVRHRGNGDTRHGRSSAAPRGRAGATRSERARVRRSGFERIDQQSIIGSAVQRPPSRAYASRAASAICSGRRVTSARSRGRAWTGTAGGGRRSGRRAASLDPLPASQARPSLNASLDPRAWRRAWVSRRGESHPPALAEPVMLNTRDRDDARPRARVRFNITGSEEGRTQQWVRPIRQHGQSRRHPTPV